MSLLSSCIRRPGCSLVVGAGTDWSGFSLLLQDTCENIIGIEPYKKKVQWNFCYKNCKKSSKKGTTLTQTRKIRISHARRIPIVMSFSSHSFVCVDVHLILLLPVVVDWTPSTLGKCFLSKWSSRGFELADSWFQNTVCWNPNSTPFGLHADVLRW